MCIKSFFTFNALLIVCDDVRFAETYLKQLANCLKNVPSEGCNLYVSCEVFYITVLYYTYVFYFFIQFVINFHIVIFEFIKIARYN